MSKFFTTAVFAASIVAGAQAVSLTATDVATVQPGGPRSGTNGKIHLNMEGSANGTFASFGVIEFGGTPAQGTNTISNIQLHLFDDPAAFSVAGPFNIYFVPDDVTSIQPGSSIAFDAGNPPGGYTAQLGSPTLLGTGSYMPGASNTEYVYSVSLAAPLASALSAGGTFRLVLTAGADNAAITVGGFGNTAVGAPALTFDSNPVPEPATIGVLALGILAIARRRRKA